MIVNHALLVSDAAAENRILPEYRRLIIDEAHHLEDAVTNGLSFRLDEITLRGLFNDLGSAKRGLMGELLTRLQTGAPEVEWKKLSSEVKRISSAITVAEDAAASDLFARTRAAVASRSAQRRPWRIAPPNSSLRRGKVRVMARPYEDRGMRCTNFCWRWMMRSDNW